MNVIDVVMWKEIDFAGMLYVVLLFYDDVLSAYYILRKCFKAEDGAELLRENR